MSAAQLGLFIKKKKKKEKRLKGIQKNCDEIQHCAEENVS